MSGFWPAVVGFSILAFLFALILMPFKRTRGVAQIMGGMAFWAFFPAMYFSVQADNQEASDAGFKSASDFQLAKAAGITEPSAWNEYKIKKAAEEAAEKQRIADEKAKAEAEKLAACRADLQCWAEKHNAAASNICSQYVERLAKNDFQWFDGTFESKFSRIRWANKKAGIVSYAGDKIKFQNGFGAWIIHTYECDYDASKGVVIDVRARQGRFPPT